MLYNKYFVWEEDNIIIGCDINANIKDQEHLMFKDEINKLKTNSNKNGFKRPRKITLEVLIAK